MTGAYNNGFRIRRKQELLHSWQKIQLTGYIRGNNNSITIETSTFESKLNIRVNGNNNRVTIKSPHAIQGLSITGGNHVPANATQTDIGEGFSIESGDKFFVYNSGNRLEIGKNCMFSNSIIVRCGGSPHLLFDRVTGEYLDISDGVYIGDHVWVGERAYITKKVTIPSECVVGACAVVTKRFEKSHTVIAGNPAKIVREGVQWIRNPSKLNDEPLMKESYQRQIKRHIPKE